MSEELKSFWKGKRQLARVAAFFMMLLFPLFWLFCIVKAFIFRNPVLDELKDGPGVFVTLFWVAFRKS